MSDIRRPRRYYLLKRLAALGIGDRALSSTWQAKQEAEAGTLLPTGFPSKAALELVGYIAAEDIDGADAAELLREAGLNARQAQSAIDAAGALI